MVTDVANIQKLTNLNDINRYLHETLAKERALDAELDRLLAKRGDLERNILVLNATTGEILELIHADSEQLLSSVQSTSYLAEKISSKVRLLDLAQSNVTLTLGQINLILDRTNCINGVQQAMDSGDYESAATYISTFIDLESKLSAAAKAADGGQMEEQRQVLLETRGKLERMVEQKLDDAISARETASVTKYCRIFAPLGKKAEGLKRFVEYLRLLVGATARRDYDALSNAMEAGKKVDFVFAFTSLLKELAITLETHEQVVREAFGPDGVVELVLGVQAECDAQATRMVRRWMEARSLRRAVQEATDRKRPSGASAGAGAEPNSDPRVVEGVIEELVLLCARGEEYVSFVLQRLREAVGPHALSAVREAALRSGQLSVTLRELAGYYTALEEHYMEESTNLAIRINEIVPGSLTSSMVDDVFFILKKCSTRAMATGSVQCACALLGHTNAVLAQPLRAVLAAKLAGAHARLLASAPLADRAVPPTQEAIAAAAEASVALNNADVAAEYAAKLRADLEMYLGADAFAAPADRELVRSGCGDLGKTALDLRALSSRALEQLSDGLLPHLRPVLDEAAQVNFNLSEAEYAGAGLEDNWVAHLAGAMQVCLEWLSPLLTVNNYEGLFHALLDKVVSRLEVLLSRKSFSQLGGLRLDRDVRQLVGVLGEMSSRTVRDKFARLNQMAMLLSLEGVEEFLDYWGDDAGHVTWRLTGVEVRQVLALRTDFMREAIASLRL